MVADLVTAYRVALQILTVCPTDKGQGMAKLAALRIGLGYPDTWIDYSTFDVCAVTPLATCAARRPSIVVQPGQTNASGRSG